MERKKEIEMIEKYVSKNVEQQPKIFIIDHFELLKYENKTEQE